MRPIEVTTLEDQPLFAAMLRDDDWARWRATVDAFAAVHGVALVLAHVPESQWARHFAANEDAADAVVSELTAIAD